MADSSSKVQCPSLVTPVNRGLLFIPVLGEGLRLALLGMHAHILDQSLLSGDCYWQYATGHHGQQTYHHHMGQELPETKLLTSLVPFSKPGTEEVLTFL